jgi:hypothetical protein
MSLKPSDRASDPKEMRWRTETPEEMHLRHVNEAVERNAAQRQKDLAREESRRQWAAEELGRREAAKLKREKRTVQRVAPSGPLFPKPSTDEREQWTSCEVCHRSPAIQIRLRSTGGYVVYRTLRSSQMVALCKECGLEALHHSQKVSAVGVATINFFAPYALAQNQKWITRLKRLPDPT